MPEADDDIASWYTLDATDRITAVCPEWDAVARQGGAATGALEGGVIGQPLGRFISGDTTRMFMDAALQAVRLTGQIRTLRYRCDTPTMRRQLEMTLQPEEQGAVRIEHRVIAQQIRQRPLVCRTDRRSAGAVAASVWRCSMCLRLQWPGLPWQSPETVAPRDLAVRYTVCSRCQGW